MGQCETTVMQYKEHVVWQETGFDFDAVEDPVEICMEDLIRINDARKGDVMITREVAEVVLAWGAEKALGPSEHLLETISNWIMAAKNPNDIPFRAMCFARVFAGPGNKHLLSIRRIAKVCSKQPGWVDTVCRNLKATLFGGRAWWPNGAEIKRVREEEKRTGVS